MHTFKKTSKVSHLTISSASGEFVRQICCCYCQVKTKLNAAAFLRDMYAHSKTNCKSGFAHDSMHASRVHHMMMTRCSHFSNIHVVYAVSTAKRLRIRQTVHPRPYRDTGAHAPLTLYVKKALFVAKSTDYAVAYICKFRKGITAFIKFKCHCVT